MTSLTPQQKQQTSSAPAAPWKTFEQFYAGNPEALQAKNTRTDLVSGTPEGDRFAPLMGQSGRYVMDYNKYRSTLSPEYQYLSGAGITPEAVSSGAVTSYIDPKTGTKVPVGQGTPEGMARTAAGAGSSHSLSPDILSRMWR